MVSAVGRLLLVRPGAFIQLRNSDAQRALYASGRESDRIREARGAKLRKAGWLYDPKKKARSAHAAMAEARAS